MPMNVRESRVGGAVGNAQAGWYDDGAGKQRWWDGERWTDDFLPQQPGAGSAVAPVGEPRPVSQAPSYVVLQVILREKFWGLGRETSRSWRTSSTVRLPTGIGSTPSPPLRQAARASVAVTGSKRR